MGWNYGWQHCIASKRFPKISLSSTCVLLEEYRCLLVAYCQHFFCEVMEIVTPIYNRIVRILGYHC